MDFVEICTIIYALKYYVKARTRRKTNAQPLDPFNIKLYFIYKIPLHNCHPLCSDLSNSYNIQCSADSICWYMTY